MPRAVLALDKWNLSYLVRAVGFLHVELVNEFEQALQRRIDERIRVRGFCVVYDHDLRLLSEPAAKFRVRQIRDIERFAAENRLSVKVRETGLNATFTPLN
ncbi:MAG: hypothetical protein QOG67_2231 [Verrucomicrobiota bacterium]